MFHFKRLTKMDPKTTLIDVSKRCAVINPDNPLSLKRRGPHVYTDKNHPACGKRIFWEHKNSNIEDVLKICPTCVFCGPEIQAKSKCKEKADYYECRCILE